MKNGNEGKNPKERASKLIRRGLIAALIIGFAANLILLAAEITEENILFRSEGYLKGLADDRDFPSLDYELREQPWGIAAGKEQLLPYETLVEYYRQSVMYDACVRAGHAEEALRRQNTMKLLREQMKNSSVTETADALDRLMAGNKEEH